VTALFQKASLIDHQHGLRIPQMLDDIAAQRIAHRLGVPQRPAQQMLKGIRRGIPAHLGQLPAVLALGRTQQAAQIGHGPLPRLSALEIGGQAALNIVQVRGPSWDHRRILVGQVKGRFVHEYHDSSLRVCSWNHDTIAPR
jgi:hypothetical protein